MSGALVFWPLALSRVLTCYSHAPGDASSQQPKSCAPSPYRALVLLLLSATPAFAQARDLGAGAMARPGDYSFEGGAAVYSHVCQSCHMADAMGAIGAGAGYPALAKNPRLAQAGYPVSVILHGQKAMLPLGGLLSDQQIADVVNYLRTSFGNRYKDKVAAADVKAAR
jgi:mono/diheme cytochrome c family protein